MCISSVDQWQEHPLESTGKVVQVQKEFVTGISPFTQVKIRACAPDVIFSDESQSCSPV